MLPAAALCLVPLAIVVARLADARAPRRHAWAAGALFGAVGWGAAASWLPIAYAHGSPRALLAYAAAVAGLATLTGISALLLHAARRAVRWPLALLLPVTWTAGEVLLERLPDVAFPWLPLGLAAAGWPWLVQVADVSGVHGASFLLAAVAGAFADARLAGDGARARWRPFVPRLAVVAAGLTLVLAYGGWRLRTPLAPLAEVVAVQPSVPLAEKHDPARRDGHVGRLVSLTREATRQGDDAPALVLWPETALAGIVDLEPAWHDSLRAASAAAAAPVVFGGVDLRRRADGVEIFNAALVADATGGVAAEPRYHKRALVPVTERIPFVNPAWLTGGDRRASKGFGRGAGSALFALPFGGVGAIICYESAFPALARASRRDGAVLLANLTNDAAFRNGPGARQHLAHAVLRAVETRTPVVRVANSGVTAYVDPLGRVHAPTGFDEVTARRYAVERAGVAGSPYLRLGDWVGVLSAAASAVLLLASTRRRA